MQEVILPLVDVIFKNMDAVTIRTMLSRIAF
jgi:hypothetical protein